MNYNVMILTISNLMVLNSFFDNEEEARERARFLLDNLNPKKFAVLIAVTDMKSTAMISETRSDVVNNRAIRDFLQCYKNKDGVYGTRHINNLLIDISVANPTNPSKNDHYVHRQASFNFEAEKNLIFKTGVEGLEQINPPGTVVNAPCYCEFCGIYQHEKLTSVRTPDYRNIISICKKCVVKSNFCKCSKCEEMNLYDNDHGIKNVLFSDLHYYGLALIGCRPTSATGAFSDAARVVLGRTPRRVDRDTALLSFKICALCEPSFAISRCCNCSQFVEVNFAVKSINGAPYCLSCYSEVAGKIHNHSYRINPVTLGKGPIWFGIELEVENTGSKSTPKMAQSVYETLGQDFIICKRDGSLSNGFEIVTVPASLEEHKKKWKPFFQKNFQTKGMKSYSMGTCGMHVHVSKKTIPGEAQKKISVLVNAPKNRPLIEAVARRYNNNYAKIQPRTLSHNFSGEDKYHAVNLRASPETLELRLFSGTLFENSFFRSLEFAEAVTHFCLNPELTDADLLKPQPFFGFVRDAESPVWGVPNKILYPNLLETVKILEEGKEPVTHTNEI